MKIFDHKRETLPRDELAQFQLERLQALLARLKRNVRRYRDLLGDTRVESLAELVRLPLTQPEDLVSAFPYGMFALPLREVVRLHSTPGPNGRQLVIGHTRNDLLNWGRLAARQLAASGVAAHDVIQLCFAGGLMKAAAGYTMGAEMVEASIIPEDPFHIDDQLAMLRNYRVSVLITTPANARALVERLRAKGIDPQSLSLHNVLLSRPVTADERESLRAGLFADVNCSFGVAEILDPGLCVECGEGRYHINEDHFLAETVNGELVVTALCREAMPLLRYCTRTAAVLSTEKCACGRTGTTIVPGERTDGRLRVNEMPLYPSQIADLLAQTRAAGTPFRLEISEHGIAILLKVTPAMFTDTMSGLTDAKHQIEREFLSRLGVQADVRFTEPRHFPQDGRI